MTVRVEALDSLADFEAAERRYDPTTATGRDDLLVKYGQLVDLYADWRRWWLNRAVEWESDPAIPLDAVEAARTAARWCRGRQQFWGSHLQRMANHKSLDDHSSYRPFVTR